MTGALAPDELARRVAAVPSVALIGGPTPLEDHPRLAAALGVDRLLVKRDDLTGVGLGGNKVRELERFLGAAAADGADVLVAGGGVAQSNHARQCAAAARRAGLDVHLVLRRGLRANRRHGNLLVTELLGAELHWVDDDPELADREGLAGVMDEVADELRARGRRPWVLHSSFHPLGAVGYVAAALELASQLADLGVDRATVVVTSMGATRIGLDLAVDVAGLPWSVVAVGWRPVDDGLPARLAGLAASTAAALGLHWSPPPERFATLDHGGPAYGVPSAEGLAALTLAARTEGLLLDPVYTAKGMAGLGRAVGAEVDPRTPVVFLHTGGLPALFAYGDEILGPEPEETTTP